MYNHYIGEICSFPFDYAPEGWLPCDGQELAIPQYQALHSIIGERFGGDGRANKFRLPNLNGVAVLGASREMPCGEVAVPAAPPDGQAKRQPYLAIAYYICHDGDYPVRPG